MESLGAQKNPNAPFIYKILINCFSFLASSEKISEICNNFIYSFQNISNLPGTPIVEHLIKSLQNKINLDCLELSRVIVE